MLHQRSLRRVSTRFTGTPCISSDTCSPINPPLVNGNRHALTTLDARSRYLLASCKSTRVHVEPEIMRLLTHVSNHCNAIPRVFLSENALEFNSRALQRYYSSFDIIKPDTTPHRPQENSLAERSNQTLFQVARANLSHARLPENHWDWAFFDAVLKYNMMAHTSTGKSPHQL